MPKQVPAQHQSLFLAFLARAGVVFGLALVGVAWLIDAYVHQTGYTISTLWRIHQEDPLLFVVDLAPVALGWMWAARERLELLTRERASLKADAAGRVIVEALVDAVVDAVLLVDPGGRVVEVNQAAERMFGMSAGAMRGRHLATLLPEHAQLSVERRHLERSERGEVLGVLWRMTAMHADGAPFTVRVGVASYEGATGPVALYVVRDDAKDRVHHTELRRRSADELRASLRAEWRSAALEAALDDALHGGQNTLRGRIFVGLARALKPRGGRTSSARLEPALAELRGKQIVVQLGARLPAVALDTDDLHELIAIAVAPLGGGAEAHLHVAPVTYEGRGWVALTITRDVDDREPLWQDPPALERLHTPPNALRSWALGELWLVTLRALAESMGGTVSLPPSGVAGACVLVRLPAVPGEALGS